MKLPVSQIGGVRDFTLSRYTVQYRVYPYRPVRIDGTGLGDIAPPSH
ncbi:hypothetical protein [Mycobacterium uberis]